jgi:hypothetical protein
MNQDYIPGEECQCSAYNESECGCGADWTPREVYELRDKAERYRLEANSLMMQRDRLAEELKEAQDAIEMMLRDSSCRRIPACTEEQLAAVKGGPQ